MLLLECSGETSKSPARWMVGSHSVLKSQSPAVTADSLHTPQQEAARSSIVLVHDAQADGRVSRVSIQEVHRVKEAKNPPQKLTLEEVHQVDEISELMEAVGEQQQQQEEEEDKEEAETGAGEPEGVEHKGERTDLRQITNEDLKNVELSKSGKRAKPQSQIVMTPQLQQLVDQLQPDENCAMNKHVNVHSGNVTCTVEAREA